MEKRITRDSLIDSYKKLEHKSEEDLDFIFLTISAAAICSFGFRMNSPAVIVGAMVISPLLFPIVGIGASLFWQKWRTLGRNFSTLIVGVFIAVCVAVLLNIIFPTAQGSEIVSRIIGNPVDYFFVALFSGLAGTFAFFWPDIIEAIAGIAISVALIPPVVMVGIGISRLDPIMIISSLGIVAINTVGILIGSFLVVAGLYFYSKEG